MDIPDYRLCMTPANLAVILLFLCACFPFMAPFFYFCYRLVFGTLYPAYASYKAVKTKNVKEYVKWMMYWIVFALFTCVETFADILVSFWLPFYYEMKILFVLWLLSPATRGSSILYRRFVHPQLTKREKEIDEYIAKARDQGYSTMLQLGSKGLSYATAVVMQTALKLLLAYESSGIKEKIFKQGSGNTSPASKEKLQHEWLGWR